MGAWAASYTFYQQMTFIKRTGKRPRKGPPGPWCRGTKPPAQGPLLLPCLGDIPLDPRSGCCHARTSLQPPNRTRCPRCNLLTAPRTPRRTWFSQGREKVGCPGQGGLSWRSTGLGDTVPCPCVLLRALEMLGGGLAWVARWSGGHSSIPGGGGSHLVLLCVSISPLCPHLALVGRPSPLSSSWPFTAAESAGLVYSGDGSSALCSVQLSHLPVRCSLPRWRRFRLPLSSIPFPRRSLTDQPGRQRGRCGGHGRARDESIHLHDF